MSESRSLRGELIGRPFIASVVRDAKRDDKDNCAFIVSDYLIPTGYRAYILPDIYPSEYANNIVAHCPNASVLYGVAGLDTLQNYDVIEVNDYGIIHIVYCDASTDNVLFITNKCNSNCIMCPDAESNRRRNLGDRVTYLKRLIELIPSDTPHLTITGGEPTLLKWDFIELLKTCRDKFHNTEILMLSNGRSFCVKEYREAFLNAVPNYFRLAVPLYADNALEHDAITQSKGSFDQTVGALKILQDHLDLELRIVVMDVNYRNLPQIATFIAKEFPRVKWVSIMAMELLGNAAINRDHLWIDYIDTVEFVEKAAYQLLSVGISASIYNYPLCGLPRGLWSIAAQSITDYKVRYKPECDECAVKHLCGGFFFSTIRYEKVHAYPIKKESDYGSQK